MTMDALHLSTNERVIIIQDPDGVTTLESEF